MTTSEKRPLRSQRLNQITHEPHTKLDALVKAHAPFETQANFARFVVAQYLFQSELVPLYNDADLTAIVPDLPPLPRRSSQGRPGGPRHRSAGTGRWRPAPSEQSPGAGLALRLRRLEAGRCVPDQARRGLGLSETFGARHLGEPAGGRAEGWKSFVKTLDALQFSAEEEAELDKGAIDAFNRFTVLLEQAYATATA
jgi:heme oxygenase